MCSAVLLSSAKVFFLPFQSAREPSGRTAGAMWHCLLVGTTTGGGGPTGQALKATSRLGVAPHVQVTPCFMCILPHQSNGRSIMIPCTARTSVLPTFGPDLAPGLEHMQVRAQLLHALTDLAADQQSMNLKP